MARSRKDWARRCEYGEHASPPALLAQLGRPAIKALAAFSFGLHFLGLHLRAAFSIRCTPQPSGQPGGSSSRAT
jgi:hypothetical protein